MGIRPSESEETLKKVISIGKHTHICLLLRVELGKLRKKALWCPRRASQQAKPRQAHRRALQPRAAYLDNKARNFTKKVLTRLLICVVGEYSGLGFSHETLGASG